MKLLFFFCLLFLAVLIIPADLDKPKKDKQKEPGGHGHEHGHEHGHGLGHGPAVRPGRTHRRYMAIIEDEYFRIIDDHSDDDDDDDDERTDWVLELQKPQGQCNPNPCLNHGVCEMKGRKHFKCDCPSHFKGRRCEKAPNICKKGRCKRGECVVTSTAPFYECKCKEPFQPPDCTTVSVCMPNPCQNGGTCVRDDLDFDCTCPSGFRGSFCRVGPNDCYVDNGESYRGNVSETKSGKECLYWNSHLILDRGSYPFISSVNEDGLGPHNFCRNPDGEKMPWCFIRKGFEVRWDYCDVIPCSKPTDVTPTHPVPPKPTEPSVQPTSMLTSRPTVRPTARTTVLPTVLPTVPITVRPTIRPPVRPTVPITVRPTVRPTVPITVRPTVRPTVPITVRPTVPITEHTAEQLSITTPVPAPAQFSTCGSPQPRRAIQRIYGGAKTIPGALPWQVSLQVKLKGSAQTYRHICGGVLIESCWVLTAGHCITKNNDMQVVVGGLSLNLPEHTEQTLQVERAIVHEAYREAPNAVYNDIALLKLKGKNGTCANETQFVKTACLPTASLPDGTECTISGWGSTESSEYGSDQLLDAKVMLINQDTCSNRKVYGNILDISMFCAGYLQGGVDSCQGDSGGPLTCKQDRTHFIYGLVSWGDKCGRAMKPGVYTRVTQFVDWINSKIHGAPIH